MLDKELSNFFRLNKKLSKKIISEVSLKRMGAYYLTLIQNKHDNTLYITFITSKERFSYYKVNCVVPTFTQKTCYRSKNIFYIKINSDNVNIVKKMFFNITPSRLKATHSETTNQLLTNFIQNVYSGPFIISLVFYIYFFYKEFL